MSFECAGRHALFVDQRHQLQQLCSRLVVNTSHVVRLAPSHMHLAVNLKPPTDRFKGQAYLDIYLSLQDKERVFQRHQKESKVFNTLQFLQKLTEQLQKQTPRLFSSTKGLWA